MIIQAKFANVTASVHARRTRWSVVTNRLVKLMRLNNLYSLQRENSWPEFHQELVALSQLNDIMTLCM